MAIQFLQLYSGGQTLGIFQEVPAVSVGLATKLPIKLIKYLQ